MRNDGRLQLKMMRQRARLYAPQIALALVFTVLALAFTVSAYVGNSVINGDATQSAARVAK